jgi:hypothetical protein
MNVRMISYRFLLILVLALALFACESPTASVVSGVQGQVYANAGPGYYEYRAKCTIIVSSTSAHVVGEFPTDTLGAFRISLPVGRYVLDVKESPDKAPSGPYDVRFWGYAEAKAYMYNSMILAP